MKKSKKQPKPIYAQDKYGLMYQVNKPLSDNDREILKALEKLMEHNYPEAWKNRKK